MAILSYQQAWIGLFGLVFGVLTLTAAALAGIEVMYTSIDAAIEAAPWDEVVWLTSQGLEIEQVQPLPGCEIFNPDTWD